MLGGIEVEADDPDRGHDLIPLCGLLCPCPQPVQHDLGEHGDHPADNDRQKRHHVTGPPRDGPEP